MKKLLSLILLPLLCFAPLAHAFTARGDYGTATAASGAVTLNKSSGTITTETLVTAAGSAYTLALTCDRVESADSIVSVSVDNGTNTTAGIELGRVTPAAGTVTILVWNRNASSALAGSLKIRYVVQKQ